MSLRSTSAMRRPSLCLRDRSDRPPRRMSFGPAGGAEDGACLLLRRGWAERDRPRARPPNPLVLAAFADLDDLFCHEAVRLAMNGLRRLFVGSIN
jgi:hypothetical protein